MYLRRSKVNESLVGILEDLRHQFDAHSKPQPSFTYNEFIQMTLSQKSKAVLLVVMWELSVLSFWFLLFWMNFHQGSLDIIQQDRKDVTEHLKSRPNDEDKEEK